MRIRAVCGEAVPALVVSGDVTVEMREVARSAGLHLLHKPLQAARLRTLLHHLVHRETSDEVVAGQRFIEASVANSSSAFRPS